MDRSPEVDVCRSWRPDLPGVTEVFHAHFTEHAYPRHCHDTWTVLLVDAGAVRYDLDRHRRAADTRRVTVLPPFVAHDGRSATAGRAFRKRVLYLENDLIGGDLVGPAVDRSAIDDPVLRRLVSDLHRALGRPREDLERESILALITDRIAWALGGPGPDRDRPDGPRSGPGRSGSARAGSARSGSARSDSARSSADAASALRSVLDADFQRRLVLGDLAGELGWSATHLIRSFTDRFGLPPHRYIVSRRIDEARRQLIDGVPPAEVAVNVGFHDQAHLGRHFKRHVGITPGRYQRSG